MILVRRNGPSSRVWRLSFGRSRRSGFAHQPALFLLRGTARQALQASSGRNLRNVPGLRVSLVHIVRIKKAATLDSNELAVR